MMLSQFRVFSWEKGTAFREDIRAFLMRAKGGNLEEKDWCSGRKDLNRSYDGSHGNFPPLL
jgi:hypothetical protein